MDLNTLILERPSFDCANDPNTSAHGVVRVHAPYKGSKTLCYHLLCRVTNNTPAPWGGFCLFNVTIGFPRSVKWYPATGVDPTGAFAKTGTISKGIVKGRQTWYFTTGTITWTAPADYAKVGVACTYNKSGPTYENMALALTKVAGSSAVLLDAVLDCHTEGTSPFQPHADNEYRLGMALVRTIATNIKAGDQITFSRESGTGSAFFDGLVGVNDAIGSPATDDNQHLWEGIFHPGDQALDDSALRLMVLDEIIGSLLYIPLSKDGSADSTFGTLEHATANNSIAGADGTGVPTVAWKYYTTAAPTGTDWAPAIGARIECQAVTCTVSAGVLMYGVLVGHLVQTITITPAGFAEHWRIIFDGTLASNLRNKTGGYSGMRSIRTGASFAISPGAFTRLNLNANDASFRGASYGRHVLLGGGVFGSTIVQLGSIPSAYGGPSNQFIEDAVEFDKYYAGVNHVTTAAPLIFTAGMILEGGWWMNVFDRSDLTALVGTGDDEILV